VSLPFAGGTYIVVNLDFMLLGFVVVLQLRHILNELFVMLRYLVLYIVVDLDRVGLGAHCQQQQQQSGNNLP
jgi:hypothetical protein